MPNSLDDLRAASQLKTGTVLQSQYTSQTINPPTWNSATAIVGGIQVSLNAPKQDDGQPYLATSAGITYQAADVNNNPIFFYQVQVSSSSSFTGSTTYDLSNSRTMTMSGISGAKYLRARARLTNGEWSQWKPYSSAVTPLGTALNTAIYQDTSSASLAGPSAYTDLAGAGGNFSVTITTTGGSVLLMFQLSHFMIAPGQTFFRFMRDSTSLGYGVSDSNATTQSVTATTSVSMSALDAVAAGTYTYKVQWQQITGGTAFAYQGALQAIELKAQ